MTQSSDREHRTPLSPVRRHESIPGLIHAFTPEPANLTALLSRRLKMPLCVIETMMFRVKSSCFFPFSAGSQEQATTAYYLRSRSDKYSVRKMRHAAERFHLKYCKDLPLISDVDADSVVSS